MNPWKGQSRIEFNRYVHHVNPDGKLEDFKAWRAANPDEKLPEVPRGTAGSGTIQDDPGTRAPGLQTAGPAPRVKVPQKYKSQELLALEREQLHAAGHPSFAVYKRVNGSLFYRGMTDLPLHQAIAEQFGGGRFELRMVDEAGYEMVGAGNVFERNIDPAVFPEKHPPLQSQAAYAPWTMPAGAAGYPGAQVYSQEDVQDAERRARADAVRDAELQSLRGRILANDSAPAGQKASDLDLLDKFLDIQKKMQPAVDIGRATPGQAMQEMVAGMATMMTAMKSMQDLVPKPSDNTPSLTEKALAKVIDAYVPDTTAPAAPAAPAPAAQPAGQAPAPPQAPQVSPMDSMLANLSVKISQMQELEFSMKEEDTVIPMARWVLAQEGMAWNMLRNQVKGNDIDTVVQFIGAKDPGLTDTDNKKAWLWQVIELVKAPAMLEGARPSARPAEKS